MVDFTGTLLESPKSVISRNDLVGYKIPQCKSNAVWNGFECDNMNLAILEWVNVTPDR